MKWEDGTSYSKFDHERIPRIWELPIKNRMTLTVHRHIYNESTWFMTLRDHGATVIDMVDMCTNNIDNAKARAIQLTMEYLHKEKDLIQFAIDDLKREFYVKYL